MSFRSLLDPNIFLKIITKRLRLMQKNLKPLYKFDLKNGIAYTEDHIPVQKLHLFGMPLELTQGELLDYFTRNYGHVLDIERIEASVPTDDEQEFPPTWNAFALFADARDAASILQNSEHLVSSYKFHVQACYSWLQPDSNEESNELEFPTSPSILQLNDDCLEYVFQYLPLADQIRLARTCTRFRNIYQSVSAREHRIVYSKKLEDLTLWEMRDFFQLSGHHIEHFICYEEGNANLKRCFFAGFNFPNLKELHMYDVKFKVHKLQRLLLGTIKLKILTLRTYPRTDRLELAHLKDLKLLQISHWNTEGLSLPTSIESLTIFRWHDTSCLPSILKDLTQIKKLRVLFTEENIFEKMARSQAFASVEVLQLACSGYDGKKLIAQLPKLKKLYLYDYYCKSSDVIQEIIKDNPHMLDHFEILCHSQVPKRKILQISGLIGLHTLSMRYPENIDGEVISEFGKLTELKRFGLADSDINDSLVLKLLVNCPKLSILRFQECPNISENLVHSIISLLRKDIQRGRNQRELPLKLYLWKCGYKNIIQSDPDVIDVCAENSNFESWIEKELGA